MQSFMENLLRLNIPAWLVSACVLLTPMHTWADGIEQPAGKLFKHLLTLQAVDTRAIESCRYAGSMDDATVAEVFSHYLGVIAEEESGRIRTEQTWLQDHPAPIQVRVQFEVSDPESPWQYGFEFNLKLDEETQAWQAVPETLRCIGAS